MVSFEINQQVGTKFSHRFIGKIVKAVFDTLGVKKGVSFSIAIVDSRTIKKLNRQYRGQDKTTEVLTFAEIDAPLPYSFPSNPSQPPFRKGRGVSPFLKGGLRGISKAPYLGEIIISYPDLKKRAEKERRTIKAMFARLLVHGILHLLGYNHQKKKEAEEMEKMEERILGKISNF